MSARIHLMHGFIGFGKTKVAKEIAHELNAVILNNADIRTTFYGKNLSPDRLHECSERVDNFIWDLTAKIINAGTDVILDFGFWTRSERAAAYKRAREITENVTFHNIQCDMDTARQSVIERHKRHPDIFDDVSKFDALCSGYEPMSADEGYQTINHDTNIKDWKYAAYIFPVREQNGKLQVAMAVYKSGWHGLIGGRLDGDETPYQAMCREVGEELGESALHITKNVIMIPTPHNVKIHDVIFRRARNERHTYFISHVPADTELIFCEQDNDGFVIKWIDLDLLADKDTIVIDDMRAYFIDTVIPFIKSHIGSSDC